VPHIARPLQVSSAPARTRLPSACPGAPQGRKSSGESGRPTLRRRLLGPSAKQLLQVAVATLLVAGCPVAVVWWLRASGTVSSAVLTVVLGMALSLAASYIGGAVWESRPGSEDLLFSELMIWGYLHRWRTQRRLASALEMLGPMSDARPDHLGDADTGGQVKLLEQLVAGMETSDPYLHGHSRRVARHSWMIARRMGVSRDEVARIRTAAAIHDVGKIRTPQAILHKAGRLNDDEYEVVKRHPGDGALMAAALGDPELTSMVRHHHERLDGTGYPDGLSGEQIPLGARIIAVADTFDAITSKRPYRVASPHKRAIDVLKDEAGTTLDAAVVRAFCGHYAGRGPLALWSFVTGLPERVLGWLGSSVATVASAAKLIAVAAVVGGAAVTSSTLAMPAAKTGTGTTHLASGTRHKALAALPKREQLLNGAAATPGSKGPDRKRRAIAEPTAQVSSPTPLPKASDGSTMAQPLHPASTVDRSEHGMAPGKNKGEEASGKGKPEESPGKRKPQEIPGQGKPEGSPGKGKSEESPAKGKPEERPAKGKPEESPSKGKPEEAPAGGKPEESPAKGRSEELPAKAKPEESPGKAKP
jgi:HD-GYP domain-containing protein (c-di-GMP phosphodiesterase class II)